MKKIICLIGVLLIAGLASHAQQGWLVAAYLSGNIENTIIRQYQDEESISYIKTNDGCFFARSDNRTVISMVEIDCTYEVRDFEIYNDTVCFCGVDGTNGIVGWFSIPDLFGGADDFHTYYTFMTQCHELQYPYSLVTSKVFLFSDLCFFDNSEDPQGRVHMALVGQNALGVACIAELKGFFAPNNWSYTTGTTDGFHESMEQVVATDNFVVACGPMSDGVSHGLRTFYKSGMFAPPPILGDYLHRYTAATSTPYDYPTKSFKMTAMDGDTVATTSLFSQTSPTIRGFVTHIINAYNASYDPIGSLCADEQIIFDTITPPYPNGTFSVNRLTYSSAKKILANLVEAPNPLTGNTSLMGEMNRPFAAVTDYFSRSGYYFHDHDNYFSENGYIAMGHNETKPSALAIFARHLLSTGIVDCGLGGSAPTDHAVFSLKHDYLPLSLYSTTFSFGKLAPLGTLELPLETICEEF